MKQKLLKWIALLISIISAIGYCIFYINIVFTNPDMTRMRLFLTYWKQFLLFIIIFFSSYGIYFYYSQLK